MCVFVKAWEHLKAEEEKTHTVALFIPPVSVGSVLITETQSHMKVISIFVERACVCVCVCKCVCWECKRV